MILGCFGNGVGASDDCMIGNSFGIALCCNGIIGVVAGRRVRRANGCIPGAVQIPASTLGGGSVSTGSLTSVGRDDGVNLGGGAMVLGGRLRPLRRNARGVLCTGAG